MIYNIGNNPETAKLLQQTMPPNTKDFGWFLATVEAMPLSQLFEVLFDSSVVVKYPIF